MVELLWLRSFTEELKSAEEEDEDEEYEAATTRKAETNDEERIEIGICIDIDLGIYVSLLQLQRHEQWGFRRRFNFVNHCNPVKAKTIAVLVVGDKILFPSWSWSTINKSSDILSD
jgi:hypothetical protein